jgi:aryl-alcohol dehydrogenase-like predicted oxidoreductase
VLPTVEEFGIGFVPYSPLSKGFLTGTVNQHTTFDRRDVRTTIPRFTPEARRQPGPGGSAWQIAARKNATPGQVARAELLAQQPWIVP